MEVKTLWDALVALQEKTITIEDWGALGRGELTSKEQELVLASEYDKIAEKDDDE
jgi:hypothetical protein